MSDNPKKKSLVLISFISIILIIIGWLIFVFLDYNRFLKGNDKPLITIKESKNTSSTKYYGLGYKITITDNNRFFNFFALEEKRTIKNDENEIELTKEIAQDLIDNYLKLDTIKESIRLEELTNEQKLTLFVDYYGGVEDFDSDLVDDYLAKCYGLRMKHNNYNIKIDYIAGASYNKKTKKYKLLTFQTAVAMPSSENIFNDIINFEKSLDKTYKVTVKKAYVNRDQRNFPMLSDGFTELMEFTTEEEAKVYFSNHDDIVTYDYYFKYNEGNFILVKYEINFDNSIIYKSQKAIDDYINDKLQSERDETIETDVPIKELYFNEILSIDPVDETNTIYKALVYNVYSVYCGNCDPNSVSDWLSDGKYDFKEITDYKKYSKDEIIKKIEGKAYKHEFILEVNDKNEMIITSDRIINENKFG